jgi:hypothetical protein
MMTAVRAAVLGSLLLAPSGARVEGSQVPGNAPNLEFLGFRPGASLDEVSRHLRNVGGGPLRCLRARMDGRVSDCRGVLRSRDSSFTVDLWISAIDSVVGVMTLSSRVDSIQLETWRRALQSRYGRVGTRIQGNQSMLQWVRRGRMIRLTWRLERRDQVASVSLVDGHVLDNWGRSRMRPTQTGALDSAQPESRTR